MLLVNKTVEKIDKFFNSIEKNLISQILDLGGFIVGGFVLNLLLDKKPKDLDVFVRSQDYKKMRRLFETFGYSDKLCKKLKEGQTEISPRNVGMFIRNKMIPLDLTILKPFTTEIPSILPCYSVNGLCYYQTVMGERIDLSYDSDLNIYDIYHQIQNKETYEIKHIERRRKKILKKGFTVKLRKMRIEDGDYDFSYSYNY